MRRATSLLMLIVVSTAAFAEDDKPLDKAKATYTQALEKAEKDFVAAFEKSSDLVRKSGKKAEEKQQVLELLKAEQSNFELHGWYPWSITSRPALVEFIRARLAAEKAYATAYDKEIDAATTAKDDARATALIRLKKDIFSPKVVARWEMTGTNWKGTWAGVLYSNGHYATPDGTAVWAYERGVITLTQPEKGLPGDRKVLKWALKDNGLELDEVGNNGAKSTGKLANVADKK